MPERHRYYSKNHVSIDGHLDGQTLSVSTHEPCTHTEVRSHCQVSLLVSPLFFLCLDGVSLNLEIPVLARLDG